MLHTQELLSDRGRTLLTIGENQNALIVSAISVWEIALKHSAGKLPLPLTVNEWFAIAKTRPGITIEPLDPLSCNRQYTITRRLSLISVRSHYCCARLPPQYRTHDLRSKNSQLSTRQNTLVSAIVHP